MRSPPGVVPEQRRQTSPAHAFMIPEPCSNRSCDSEGAAMPAIRSATANPVPASRAFAALFQLDCILIPPSRLEDDVEGMLIDVRVSRTAKIRWSATGRCSRIDRNPAHYSALRTKFGRRNRYKHLRSPFATSIVAKGREAGLPQRRPYGRNPRKEVKTQESTGLQFVSSRLVDTAQFAGNDPS